MEVARKEREAKKKEVRAKRKAFRTLCKERNYFCKTEEVPVQRMSDLEFLCDSLTPEE